MNLNRVLIPFATALVGILTAQQAVAAIAMDRTRIIYNGEQRSISVNISNENQQLPYLAQSWLEDENGKKVKSPLVTLPPVQRVEPGAKSAIKIQTLPAVAQLPQDRESLFYFNLREIPPRSDKSNVLQIALQTRVKLFYRPKAIIPDQAALATPWQSQLTLTREGDSYKVINPTPYYITLVSASPSAQHKAITTFNPVMVAPKSSTTLTASAAALGSAPRISYINDYGGRPTLEFNCSGNSCNVVSNKVE